MTNEEAIEILTRKTASKPLQFMEALTHAIEVLRADAWMPIESAPRDGTVIIGFPEIRSMDWDDVYEWSNCDGESFNPTHWRPLPQPPQKGE